MVDTNPNPEKAFFKKKIEPSIGPDPDPDPDLNPAFYYHPTGSWSLN